MIKIRGHLKREDFPSLILKCQPSFLKVNSMTKMRTMVTHLRSKRLRLSTPMKRTKSEASLKDSRELTKRSWRHPMRETKMKFPLFWESSLTSLKRWVSTKLISKQSGKMISHTKGWDHFGAVKMFWEKSWIMLSRSPLSTIFHPTVFGLTVSQASPKEWDSSLELRSNHLCSITPSPLQYFWIPLLCRWSHPPWPQSWKHSSSWEMSGSLGFSSMKCSSNGMPSE